MRVITLDSNKAVTSFKTVNDDYLTYHTLQDNEIISDIGEIGQIQQLDGSFITPTPPVPTLQDVQNAKMQEILDKFNAKLTSGFTSSANGINTTFAYGSDDQTTFLKLGQDYSLGFVTYPFPIPDINHKIAEFADATQLQKLFQDIKNNETNLRVQMAILRAQTQACTTIDQVNTLPISF